MKLYRETGSTIQTQNILHNELKHETHLTKRHRGTLPNSTWTVQKDTMVFHQTDHGQTHEQHIRVQHKDRCTVQKDTMVFHQTDHGQTHEQHIRVQHKDRCTVQKDTIVFHQTDHRQTHLMKTYAGTAHGQMHRTGRHNSTPPDRSRTDTSYGKIYGYSTKQLTERQLLQIETLAFSQTACGQNNRTERHTGTLPNSSWENKRVRKTLVLHQSAHGQTHIADKHIGSLSDSSWTDTYSRKTHWFSIRQLMDRHI